MEKRRDKVFFDLETTGVNTNRDRIVEICMIKTNPDYEIVDRFYSLINPTIPIPSEASNVHGITDDKIKDSPTFKDKSKEIFEFLDGCDLGGYNSNRFDIPLLCNEFKRVEITLDIININVGDIFLLETIFNPNTLSNVYKRYFGKEFENAHSAEADVIATIEILKSQIKKYDLPNEFDKLELLSF